jgi:hypothetical protein
MSHIINFPVKFQFQKCTAAWDRCSAQVVGWAEREDGSADTEYVRVCAEGLQMPHFFKLRLEHLEPIEMFEACIEAGEDDDIAGICEPFRLEVLVNTFSERKAQSPADAWEVRTDFLRIPQDKEALIGFLNRWGTWSNSNFEIPRLIFKQQRQLHDVLLSLSSFPSATLLNKMRGFWFQNLEPTTKYPFFETHVTNCSQAIDLTIIADFFSRLRFRKCARHDCKEIFPVRSQHGQKYCGYPCAHLESVRRGRLRQRELRAKSDHPRRRANAPRKRK